MNRKCSYSKKLCGAVIYLKRIHYLCDNLGSARPLE